jgi:hypothetical protein
MNSFLRFNKTYDKAPNSNVSGSIFIIKARVFCETWRKQNFDD